MENEFFYDFYRRFARAYKNYPTLRGNIARLFLTSWTDTQAGTVAKWNEVLSFYEGGEA